MAYANLPKDSSGVPLPVLYVHGLSWIPLQGSTTTDSDGGNLSTPANFNLVQILSNPASRTNGLPISGDNGATVVVLPLEALNNLLKASLYGKHTNPGDTALSVDASGNLGVNVISGTVSATNPSVGADGSAAPTSSTQIGGSDGTNLQPLQVDGSKNLKVVQQGTITEVNSASILADLATLAGVVSSAKAAVKAAAGDIADLATIAGAISSSLMQANLAKINGTTASTNAGNRDGGTQRVTQAGNGTPTITQVSSSATSAQALAANTSKTGTMFYNDSTQICYLLYGTGTASPTNYSVKIYPQTLFEDPFHMTCAFTVVWAAANGFLYCTEAA